MKQWFISYTVSSGERSGVCALKGEMVWIGCNLGEFIVEYKQQHKLDIHIDFACEISVEEFNSLKGRL